MFSLIKDSFLFFNMISMISRMKQQEEEKVQTARLRHLHAFEGKGERGN